jgi:hypothetical protein
VTKQIERDDLLYFRYRADIINGYLIARMDTLENSVISATQSCESLLLTVYGLPSESTISKLRDQLKALTTVLGLLHRNMSKTRDEFAVLKLPVQACRDICENLNEKIKQEASSGFQNWASLEWGGANIAALTNRLKLYTSTIAIEMITVGT